MAISSSEPSEPRRGLQGDLQRAKEGSFATAAELREFVQNLRGKSPQEVLGTVANSGLIQGVAIATLGTICFMAAFTAGPYFLYGKPVQKVKADAAAQDSDNKVATAVEAAQSKPVVSTDAKKNVEQTLDKMGESETKMADPKVNPLDKEVDDLLDSKK